MPYPTQKQSRRKKGAFSSERARINKGFTKVELAELLSIDRKTIARLEAGETVTLKSAKKFAKFYGVEITDLEPFRDMK